MHVKITLRSDGNPNWIHSDEIRLMGAVMEGEQLFTRLVLSDRKTLDVKEAPGEILAQLSPNQIEK